MNLPPGIAAKLRYIIVLLTAILCFVLPSGAQQNAVREFNNGLFNSASGGNKVEPKRLENPPLEKTLLWKISGNGLTQPSYIFGTIHMICEEDFLWDNRIEQAFNSTEHLVLEVDIAEVEALYGNVFGTLGNEKYFSDEIEDPEEAYYIKSIADILGDVETWRIWRDSMLALASEGYSIDEIENFVCGVRVELERRLQRAQTAQEQGEAMRDEPDGGYYGTFKVEKCNKLLSYEGMMTNKARKRNMSISGLESIEEQLGILVEDEEVQYQANDERVYQLQEKIGNPIEYLISVYLREDLNHMLEIMVLPEMGVHNIESFLFVRNENWVMQLPALMQQKPVFIAVGAAHLPGKRGMIQLLKDMGYSLTPIMKP